MPKQLKVVCLMNVVWVSRAEHKLACKLIASPTRKNRCRAGKTRTGSQAFESSLITLNCLTKIKWMIAK